MIQRMPSKLSSLAWDHNQQVTQLILSLHNVSAVSVTIKVPDHTSYWHSYVDNCSSYWHGDVASLYMHQHYKQIQLSCSLSYQVMGTVQLPWPAEQHVLYLQ